MNIALITSTIAPDPSVFALKVIDPIERLSDYKTALSFYCAFLKCGVFDKIVYVDNSSYDLTELRNIVIKNGVQTHVEFISYKSTIDVTTNSRFYLEINLVDYFVKHSIFLRENPSCTIWKITGRYLIKNIDKIVNSYSAKDGYDLYINHRNYPYKVIDFYLVGFTLSSCKSVFLDNLHLYEGKKDGEIILRDYLDTESLSNIRVLRRFPFVPRLLGRRGFDGARYGGIKDSAKYYLRLLLNTMFPHFWI